jgi:GTP cyclohydrolase IA
VSAAEPAPTTDLDVLEDSVARILEVIARDPGRPGLRGTPRRVARSLLDLTDGYDTDVRAIVRGALYAHEGSDPVMVRDIAFYSLCEHHMLPMFGRCHIGYVPARKVIGISKLPRLVDVFAHRLQMQERMTREIAVAIEELTGATGVGVVTEARHLCVEMRGVHKSDSVTVSSSLLGDYRRSESLRAELMSAVERHGVRSL